VLQIRAQAVGWPPVRSYRRNVMTVQSVKTTKEEEPEKQQPAANAGSNSSAFVKVSMDGAPYLRKVDLNMYNSYKDLSIALKKMFSTFTTGTTDGKYATYELSTDINCIENVNLT
jgi:auxin-responsive protein IAA